MDSDTLILGNSAENIPKSLRKYWINRYSLFHKFDDGILLTKELWFSVTPESIAIFLAKFFKHCFPEAKVVLDLFCGGGGNLIQFAKLFDKVIGIDYNEINLTCTRGNALVYGIDPARYELWQTDWSFPSPDVIEALRKEKVDIAFASPPWGGPGYKSHETFNPDMLQPLPIRKLLESMFSITENVVLFLPRNTDLDALARVTRELKGRDAKCKVTKIHTEGYLKGILCYWGDGFTSYVKS